MNMVPTFQGPATRSGGGYAADALGLHYGNRSRPMMHVVADDAHRGMWRILTPDGELSDMVNLTRAKDAAKIIAVRQLSTEESVISRARLHWKRKV